MTKRTWNKDDAPVLHKVQKSAAYLTKNPEMCFFLDSRKESKMECTLTSSYEDSTVSNSCMMSGTPYRPATEPVSNFTDTFQVLSKYPDQGTIKNDICGSYYENSIKLNDDRVINLVSKKMMISIDTGSIATNDLQLIIIQWDPLSLISNDKSKYTFSELNKNTVVYDSFKEYYRIQLYLLLDDVWENVHKKMKSNEKRELNFVINTFEYKATYLRLSCVRNINCDDIENLPSVGCIAVVILKSYDKKYLKVLAYVDGVDYVLYSKSPNNRNKCSEAKVSFIVAYKLHGLDIDGEVKIQGLINITHFLIQHDALLNLRKYPLREAVLNPRGPSVNSFVLPHIRLGIDQIKHTIQMLKKVICLPHSQINLLKTESESNIAPAIDVLITEVNEVLMSKILICIKSESDLEIIAKNFSDKKLVIIGKSSEYSRFQKYTLDKLAKDAENVDAKRQVLQESQILLKKISDCTFENIHLIRELNILCCVIYDASLCTEAETLVVGVCYCIDKLILIGKECDRSSTFFRRSLYCRSMENY
ncbi:hypothetical protein X975_24191, partial [Stegodyphus mimosarum]